MTAIEKAKAYQREKYLLSLLNLALQLVLLVVLIGTGLSFVFKNMAEAICPPFYSQVTVYLALFSIYFLIFEFPFAVYSEYFLEKKFELSNHTFKSWLVEFLKKTLLAFLLTLPLVLGLYFLIGQSPTKWWLWAWLGFTGFSYILGQLFPVLIVPLFYRYGKVEDEALKERIIKLVARFGLPLGNVYSLNLSKTTKKANAMFAGLGRTKRLVLGDTLIKDFTPEEIESVVAHELGHFKHHDIWLQLGFSFVTSFFVFLLSFNLLQSFAPALGYAGAGDLAAFPFLYLMFFAAGLILTPLSNAYSRWREREADRFALKALGPKGFIPAMEKLAQINLADPSPHPLVEWWFYTHPPIAKRIQMGRKFLTAALILFLFGFSFSLAWAEKTQDSDREAARESVEKRGRVEILRYFLGDPKGGGLNVPVAIELYNQGVEFYEKREFALAREALQDSLARDPKNPLAHELLGDIAYNEQKLDEAHGHYAAALGLKSTQSVKDKLVKVERERKVESKLVTQQEEHFLIKYRGEERGLEGFELQEFLRTAYREVGQDFGYFFRQKVVVLLYDGEEFRSLIDLPHWSTGLYDGKIRLPAYQKGFTPKEIQKIMRHELTHAFISEMSRGKCPAWLNEGLAEYEEAKVVPLDPTVFQAAVKTNTLFSLVTLLARENLTQVTDPLEVSLFYQQAYHLVDYLVKQYGMFRIKKMIELFGQGKDSFEVIEEVIKISPVELEKRWKESLAVPS